MQPRIALRILKFYKVTLSIQQDFVTVITTGSSNAFILHPSCVTNIYLVLGYLNLLFHLVEAATR